MVQHWVNPLACASSNKNYFKQSLIALITIIQQGFEPFACRQEPCCRQNAAWETSVGLASATLELQEPWGPWKLGAEQNPPGSPCAQTESPQGESLDPSPGFCAHCRSDLGAVEVAAKEAAKHNEIMEIWVDGAAFPLPWGEQRGDPKETQELRFPTGELSAESLWE